MKNIAKTLSATLLVSIISVTGFASIASANGPNNNAGPNAERNQGPHNGQKFRGARDRGGLMPLRLVCSDRGQTRIENGLTRIAERIDLTSEQVAALDDFKTSALSAQAAFNEVCADFRPGKDADLIDRMKSRQAAIAAQLVGIQSVMPTFEVFFDSLSEQQKAQLRPHMRPHQTMGPNRNGPPSNSDGPSSGA